MAVARVEERGLEIMDLQRDDFVLPTLADRLDGIADEVIDGRGIGLIRGVPVERYSRLQAGIAFWGIGTYLGVPVSQNAKGHLLGHVADLGSHSLKNPKHRGYQTHDMLPIPLRLQRRGGADVPASGQVRWLEPLHPAPSTSTTRC